MPKFVDAVVVGAGITGAATAYFLRQGGASRVLLIDRAGPAAGGTGKSAAIIRQHYSTPVAVRLAMRSIELFARMEEDLGARAVFERCGYRMLVPPELLAAARRNVAMHRRQGVVTEWTEVSAEWSPPEWLNPEGVAAVIHEPDGGYADPVRATEAYVQAFREAGGDVRTRAPVRRLCGGPHEVTGVVLDAEEIHAGAVVNAAGPWAGFLSASVGIDLAIRAIREQDTIWEARPGRPLPDTPVSNAVDATYYRPMGGSRVLLGRGFPKPYEEVDPYNYKETADEEQVSEVVERSELRFPPLRGARRIDSYAALYDVTPDWYPFVGPRAGVAGYFDANGGSGHGFKLGPAIGEELARWILSGDVADDFRQFSFDRIAAGDLFTQAYGGNRG